MSVWETILERIKTLQGIQRAVFEKIGSAKDASQQSFNLVENLPDYHESMNSIRARSVNALDMFMSLESTSTELTLVPMSYLEGLSASLKQMTEDLNAISTAFSNLEAHGGIGSINVSSTDATSSNQQYSFRFADSLLSLDKSLDNALDNFYKIALIVRPSNFANFSNTTQVFSDILDEFTNHKSTVAGLLDDSNTLKQRIDSITSELESKLTATQQLHQQIAEMITSANISLNEINTAQASVVQKIPSIEEARNKAAVLKTDIEAYQLQFDQFKTEMDTRNQKLHEGNTSLDALVFSLKTQEEEVIRINKEAASALNFATVAGLAKGFGDRLRELDRELGTSHRFYMCAIGFLFFSTSIPVAYIFTNVLGFFPDKEIRHEELLVLLLLIVPSAIVTRFTSSRYNRLFRLREQYAHKFAVAFSMEGFKGQLGETSQQSQLVATTFAQLSSNNPADSIEQKNRSEDHPLPLWNKFLETLFPNN